MEATATTLRAIDEGDGQHARIVWGNVEVIVTTTNGAMTLVLVAPGSWSVFPHAYTPADGLMQAHTLVVNEPR